MLGERTVYIYVLLLLKSVNTNILWFKILKLCILKQPNIEKINVTCQGSIGA